MQKCQTIACTASAQFRRSEEHTSELQSRLHLVCRLLLEKKNNMYQAHCITQSTVHHCYLSMFFFSDTASTEIYTLSLHDALPILVFIFRKVPRFGFTDHLVRPCDN